MNVVCPPKNKLRSLSLGLLNEEESGELIRHLDRCDSCQAEIQSVESLEDTLINGLKSVPIDSTEDEFENEQDCQLAGVKALAALGSDLAKPNLRIPKQLGEYEIIRPLAHGGMGQVYLGRHTKLARYVAIKVIAEHRIMDDAIHDRFEAEMKNIGRLSHPNIVQAFDAREIEGIAVLVTEYIDGLNANELLKRNGSISVADACAIVTEMCNALEYVNRKGLIHRDVKPSNIMIDSKGQVRLLDLGLARLQSNNPDSEFTGTGQAVGTVDYVAPEQINGEKAIDIRTDIYSLGCTFYKLLSGQPPFPSSKFSTNLEKLNAHVSETPELIEIDQPIPTELKKLMKRMLEKDPVKRPATLNEVKNVVDSFVGGANLEQLVVESIQRPAIAESVEPKPLQFESTQGIRKWPWITLLVGALAGVVFGFWLGVVVTIKKQDGTSANIEIPDSSIAVIDSEGNITVELGGDKQVKIAAEDVTRIGETERLVEFETEQPVLLKAQEGDWVDVIALPVMADGNLIRRRMIASKKSLHSIAVNWSGEKDLMGQPTGKAKVKFELSELELSEVENARSKGQEIAIVSHSDETGASINLAKLQGVWRGISRKEKGGSLRSFEGGPLVVKNDSFVWEDMEMKPARVQGFIGSNTVMLVLDKPVDGINVFYLPFKFNGDDQLEISISFQPNTDLESSFATFRMERVKVPREVREELLLDGLDAFGTAEMECSFHLARSPGQGTIPDGLELVEVREYGNQQNPIKLWMQTNPLFTNRDIVSAEASEYGEGSVSIKLSEESSDRWNAKLTQFDVHDVHYVVKLDGKVFSSSSSFFDNSSKYSFYRHTNIFVGDDVDKQKEIAAQIVPELKIKTAQEHWNEQMSGKIDNLRWINQAFLSYESQAFKLPASRNSKEGGKPYSWRIALLPSLGYQKLYDEYRFNEDWDSEHNIQLLSKMPPCFRTNNDPEDSTTTSYVAIVADHSAVGLDSGTTIAQISDGTSNTLLVVETTTEIPWTKPEDFALTDDVVQKLRASATSGLRMVTVDGTIRLLDRNQLNLKLLEIITNGQDRKVHNDW